MDNFSKYIQNATDDVNSMIDRLNEGELLSYDDAQMLTLLKNAVVELRNKTIHYDYKMRLSGKDLAKKYNLSEARISQILNNN
jgi:DNA-directed RNA polymerase specialized sigma subunit